MWRRKASASEPLRTCRNRRNDVKTGGVVLTREKPKRGLLRAWVASGIKVARSCIWLSCGTWEPVVSMAREKSKWKTHEDERTDTRHRGGVTRSSDELRQRGGRRRGGINQPWLQVNLGARQSRFGCATDGWMIGTG